MPLGKIPGTFTIHSYVLGDCNGNGRIDIGDAVWLINYLLGTGVPPDPVGRGDCNLNGRIDIVQAIDDLYNCSNGETYPECLVSKKLQPWCGHIHRQLGDRIWQLLILDPSSPQQHIQKHQNGKYQVDDGCPGKNGG